jgi:hypothetical protein
MSRQAAGHASQPPLSIAAGLRFRFRIDWIHGPVSLVRQLQKGVIGFAGFTEDDALVNYAALD